MNQLDKYYKKSLISCCCILISLLLNNCSYLNWGESEFNCQVNPQLCPAISQYLKQQAESLNKTPAVSYHPVWVMPYQIGNEITKGQFIYLELKH